VDAGEIRRGIGPRLRRPFSRARIEEFVERLLGGRSRAPIGEAAPACDEDFVRLIYLAAYGLDRRSGYSFEPAIADGARSLERQGPYGYPPGDLRKKRKEGQGWTS
jgi:hypothetical protein